MLSPNDHYFWDNWLCHSQSQQKYYRFSLVAPRTVTPPDRHFCAELHMWSSNDREKWDYVAKALMPGEIDKQKVQAVWTGSAHGHENDIVLFFSVLKNTQDFEQMIGQAHLSYTGELKSVRLPVVEPSEKFGYLFTDEDGSIPAWRDPFVFFNPHDELWHMVFAAKNKKFSPFHSCLGHATSDRLDSAQWTLQPPIDIDAQSFQVETPSLFLLNNRYYCGFAVKLESAEETTENLDFFWYEADNIKGPWRRAETLSANVLRTTQHHDTYGWKIFRDPHSPSSWSMCGFNAEHSEHPFTWTPVVNCQ